MLYITDCEKQELLDSVDMLELVEDLGFDCKKVGSHYSILCPCPNHSDKNKGNCIVYPKNVYCFGCGKSYDAIALVCEVKHCDTYKAVCYLAELQNKSNDFEQNGRKFCHFNHYKKLDDTALNLLGLNLKENECYSPISISATRKKYCRRDSDDFYFQSAYLNKPKLSHLKIDEPEVYQWLIKNKANEQIEKYDDLILKLQRDHNFYSQVSDFLNNIDCSVQDILDAISEQKQLILNHLSKLLN